MSEDARRTGGAGRTDRAGGTGNAGNTDRAGGTGNAGNTDRAGGTGNTGNTSGIARTGNARGTARTDQASGADHAGGTGPGGSSTKFEELPDAPPKRPLRLTRVGKAAVSIVAFWLAIAVVGPWVAPYHEADLVADDSFTEAGRFCSEWEPDQCSFHLLGTDYLGRDILSRIIYGARTTIGISVAATVLAYLIGVTLGIAAAVGGVRLDTGLSRLNDAFISMPNIMLGLVVIAAVGSTIPILVVTAGCIFATVVFRIARALALDVMVSDFVEAARGRGEGLWWIIRKEILPNIAMPLATDFGLRLVFIILFTSSLSFLGLGVQPPHSDWGSMVRENLQGLAYGSLAPIAPAIAIATLTISINLIVDDVSTHAGGRLVKRML